MPLAVCVPREGRSGHGPTVQAVAVALRTLSGAQVQPSFGSHSISQHGAWDLALSEAARIICVFYINRNKSMSPCVWLLSHFQHGFQLCCFM